MNSFWKKLQNFLKIKMNKTKKNEKQGMTSQSVQCEKLKSLN